MWANGAWTVKRQDVAPLEISKLMNLSEAIANDEGEDFCDF